MEFNRLKNAEYGCAIPFKLGTSQVLNGNIYEVIIKFSRSGLYFNK